MIVKIEGPIATFAKWKAMVQSNSEKIKKYGMTFLYAGTEKDNDVSGKYLIYELRHVMLDGKSSTQLNLIRDLFTGEPKEGEDA